MWDTISFFIICCYVLVYQWVCPWYFRRGCSIIYSRRWLHSVRPNSKQLQQPELIRTTHTVQRMVRRGWKYIGVSNDKENVILLKTWEGPNFIEQIKLEQSALNIKSGEDTDTSDETEGTETDWEITQLVIQNGEYNNGYVPTPHNTAGIQTMERFHQRPWE